MFVCNNVIAHSGMGYPSTTGVLGSKNQRAGILDQARRLAARDISFNPNSDPLFVSSHLILIISPILQPWKLRLWSLAIFVDPGFKCFHSHVHI